MHNSYLISEVALLTEAESKLRQLGAKDNHVLLKLFSLAELLICH